MLIPLMFVRDVTEAIAFYTGVLDFHLAEAMPEEAPFYAVLVRSTDELHLNRTPGEHRQPGHGCAIVLCDDVDSLYAQFRSRGLTPARPGSPVHQAPLDQTWGTRELYVDDPDGNTLVFQQRR
ncbi:hypothetical protein E4L96_16170 [Massilia arenosa]|uniref:VOC domain-containing protein n=1 Tax=Zemynaea arenosa TaxID=2561931 RepID=A0A4Y9S8Z8_9BURK|nr:VOC family protein [Massilia arenosa]TFW16579.1 hypothetical protein E4L96_16170 [Massilia arenosa]